MSFPLILVIIPIIAIVSAQLLKVIPLTMQHGFKISHFWAYGSMPSSHTSFVTSIATIAALQAGLNSLAFAIAAVFALIIIRDALGLRRHMSDHSVVVNKMARDLSRLNGNDVNQYKHLPEGIGHRPTEILAGAAFGIALTWLLYFLLV